MKQVKFILCALVFFLLSPAYSFGEDFPLRAKYPNVKYITTDQLADQYDNTIIVDVRSKFEYEVVRINKAVHNPVAKATFTKNLQKIRSKKGSTPIAMYCNGHTCAKSYKAVAAAQKAGFDNVLVYDAGIFEWTVAHPDKATLMDQSPAPKSKIIPKSDLVAKKIDWAEFKAKAKDSDSVIIDVRDPFQRKVIPKLAKLRNIPLDRITGLLKQKKFADNQLLIFDAVGKQVRWLQYHLEANGYSNYYFLNKGALEIK